MRNYFTSVIPFLSLLFSPLPAWSKEDLSPKEPSQQNDKKPPQQEEPPKVGNFALPTPQQPGPFVSFGQHVINENQTQFYLLADDFRGNRKYKVDLVPPIIHGITDAFSVTLNAPIAVRYKEGPNHSKGWEDIAVQLEYAFYDDKTARFADQATLFTSITFPTGSVRKQPETGFSSSSFFLGATFNRLYTDWFAFTSQGILLTTSDEGTKAGDAFAYQGGLGRNIYSKTAEFIVAGMIELDGQYAKKDKIKKMTDPNSGGNNVYLTPSLWFSTNKVIIQLGFGWPITQHLFGDQKRNSYVMAANFGWTF